MRHANGYNNKHYYFLSFLIYNAKSFKVAPVAQLDRVPGFEPGGRGFESLRARQTTMAWGSHRNLQTVAGFLSLSFLCSKSSVSPIPAL